MILTNFNTNHSRTEYCEMKDYSDGYWGKYAVVVGAQPLSKAPHEGGLILAIHCSRKVVIEGHVNENCYNFIFRSSISCPQQSGRRIRRRYCYWVSFTSIPRLAARFSCSSPIPICLLFWPIMYWVLECKFRIPPTTVLSSIFHYQNARVDAF